MKNEKRITSYGTSGSPFDLFVRAIQSVFHLRIAGRTFYANFDRDYPEQEVT